MTLDSALHAVYYEQRWKDLHRGSASGLLPQIIEEMICSP